MSAPALEPHCGSWIVVCRQAGSPVLETFSKTVAEAVNSSRYEVLTAAQWLGRFNRSIKQPQETLMQDEVEMLKLRVGKFPPRILKDAYAATLILRNTGWNCELVDAHIGDAIAFAIEKRREWLRVRRERRRREREEDLAWRRQIADRQQAIA